MQEPPALDPAALARLRQLQRPGQPDIVMELIGLFLQETPRQCAAVREAVECREAETLRRAAHAVKSNATSLGASELRGVACQLEQLAASGTTDGAERLLTELDGALVRLKAVLAQLGDEGAACAS